MSFEFGVAEMVGSSVFRWGDHGREDINMKRDLSVFVIFPVEAVDRMCKSMKYE